jgi:hypothetical protein
MSGRDGSEREDHPGAPSRERQPPLYRVMIACGIAGVLIAIGAAAVDFGTGRHPKLPGSPDLPSDMIGSVRSGVPSPPSVPPTLSRPTDLPTFPVPSR